MTEARTLLRLLREFPGYTLASLRAESSELLQLVKIEALGRPDEGGDADG